MYKHLEDNGDINVLINTDGNALLVCSACGHKWFGNFVPFVETTTRNSGSSIGVWPSPARESFVRVLSVNQDLVRSMNIDIGKL